MPYLWTAEKQWRAGPSKVFHRNDVNDRLDLNWIDLSISRDRRKKNGFFFVSTAFCFVISGCFYWAAYPSTSFITRRRVNERMSSGAASKKQKCCFFLPSIQFKSIQINSIDLVVIYDWRWTFDFDFPLSKTNWLVNSCDRIWESLVKIRWIQSH